MRSMTVFVVFAHVALAQDPVDAGVPVAPATTAPPVVAPSPIVFGAYAEALYSFNFNQPSNGITNFRGFDNRHNTFTLSNVAVDATWDYENVIGKVTLQVGHTPSTYYASEPALPGALGANLTGAELWKYVQQGYVGYRFPLGRGLSVVAGIFLSPIGPESMAVKDNWNWSRSNLFFGLPFYHTGVKATYTITDAWVLTVAGFNGWNSVVDNNPEKSVMVQATYTTTPLALSLLYFGGVERSPGAAEGRPWRNLFDGHLTWNATSWLSVLVHLNGGFEPNQLGTNGWLAGAVATRFQLIEPLFLALRGDVFAESVPGGGSAIFWPAPWVSSGTATLDYRPHAHVSIRLEYRHDHAGAPMFFGGAVVGDGVLTPFVATRISQDTLTLGVTTWF